MRELENNKDSMSVESANDRIAALRQQFMNFRKQSEVMNIKPLDMHRDISEANLTADKASERLNHLHSKGLDENNNDNN